MNFNIKLCGLKLKVCFSISHLVVSGCGQVCALSHPTVTSLAQLATDVLKCSLFLASCSSCNNAVLTVRVGLSTKDACGFKDLLRCIYMFRFCTHLLEISGGFMKSHLKQWLGKEIMIWLEISIVFAITSLLPEYILSMHR